MARSEPKRTKRLWHAPQNQRLTTWLLWGGVIVLVAAMCITVISPERFNLHVGDVAKKTITASKDVMDEETTKQRQEAAAAQVHEVSYKDEDVAGEVMQTLRASQEELRAVQRFAQGLRDQQSGKLGPADAPIASAQPKQHAAPDASASRPVTYTKLDLQSAAALIPSVKMNDEQLRTLMDMSTAELDNLCQNLTASVRSTLDSSILEGELDKAIINIQRLVAYNTSSVLWWNVAYPTLTANLKPNMLVDQESTEANRQKARSEVEPSVYKQGENIVVAGERVTAPQLAVLNTLGLIQGTRHDTEPYIGVGLLVALLMGGLYLFLILFIPDLLTAFSKQVLLLLILVLVLGLCIGFQQLIPQVIPVALGALLTAIMLGTRTAMGMNTVLSLLLGLLVLKGSTANSAQSMSVMIMSMLGGLVGIWVVRSRASRNRVLLAGLLIGAANALALFAVGLITTSDLHAVLQLAAYSLGAGVIASVLCLGIQPALELMFNLVTPAKLMELSNPNQPILRRLMIETPGTYHHSMVVANIAEAAAEAVGANPLLARVGAYYHDIGKMKRPSYFKENQLGENPHDHTDPLVSTAILVAHVRDGVALGQRYHLPQRVLDIIAQHHGDTPVLYFYNKAMQMREGQPVDIKDFRYEGPKPRTIEAALVMLADTVEAAIRTLQDASPEKIDQTIRRLVKGKVDDGQLNDTPLTFRDLDRICNAFSKVLSGVFHERIEYPKIEIHPVKELPPEVRAYMEEQQLAEGEDRVMPETKPEVKPEAKPEPKPEPRPAAKPEDETRALDRPALGEAEEKRDKPASDLPKEDA